MRQADAVSTITYAVCPSGRGEVGRGALPTSRSALRTAVATRQVPRLRASK